ncbi:SAM-dependent methyltransferase [Prescottella subtropica]|uniref:SAM-dependent methyltransferase n=1 Tax=Prescottella subtropica TaxID=2545757 RepID=UPI0019D64B6B|nr:class I SAM-dependent methyltransferase [Prescottella subtropica]
MFDALARIHTRPVIFSSTTIPELWTDPHISERMLATHLDPGVDLSSYRGELIERAVAFVTERFALGPGRRLADFGCGPGLYTRRFAETGCEVTGLDFSRRSIEYARAAAREAGRDIRYLHQDYLTYRDTARYDVVVMIMRDYCAMIPDARRRLLGVVREHLADGGSFFFDVDAAPAFDRVEERVVHARSLMDGFFSPRPYFGFLDTFRYEQERVSLDKYEIVEQGGTRTYFNWTQFFTPGELTAELREAGLSVVEVLGDVAGAPYDPAAPQFAVIAQVSTE